MILPYRNDIIKSFYDRIDDTNLIVKTMFEKY